VRQKTSTFKSYLDNGTNWKKEKKATDFGFALVFLGIKFFLKKKKSQL
jgi:hypothetical protein